MARTGTLLVFLKTFDPEVFTGYISERDPINSLLISSGCLTPAPPCYLTSALSSENNVTTIPFYIPFEGDALNYDGVVNNVPVELEGKKMTAMAFRRMKAWKEKDFTHMSSLE